MKNAVVCSCLLEHTPAGTYLHVIKLLSQQAAWQAAVGTHAEHAADGEVAIGITDVQLLGQSLAIRRPPTRADAANQDLQIDDSIAQQ